MKGNKASKRPGNGQRARRSYRLTRPVFFIGFMGAGKTTISRMIARKYGLASVDMDSYIVRQEGCTVSEIFAERGEAGFRAVETDVLKKLSETDSMLISCGGGVVVTTENREILKNGGCVVFLKTTAAQAKSRINDLSTRPLFNELEEAERRNKERLPLYEEVATITVDVVGKGKRDVCREVVRSLFRAGVLQEDDPKGPEPEETQAEKPLQHTK